MISEPPQSAALANLVIGVYLEFHAFPSLVGLKKARSEKVRVCGIQGTPIGSERGIYSPCFPCAEEMFDDQPRQLGLNTRL